MKLTNRISLFICTLLSMLVVACDGPGKTEVTDAEAVDLNGDGTVDIRFENEADGYYQLTDRNFDGRVDESIRYDLEHFALSGKSDDDFDGIFETTIEFDNSLISRLLVDTNANQIVDLVHLYQNSLLERSIRYTYNEENDGTSVTATVSYKFGFPRGEVKRSARQMSEMEFGEQYQGLTQSEN